MSTGELVGRARAAGYANILAVVVGLGVAVGMLAGVSWMGGHWPEFLRTMAGVARAARMVVEPSE
jgi:hypothetical protein